MVGVSRELCEAGEVAEVVVVIIRRKHSTALKMKSQVSCQIIHSLWDSQGMLSDGRKCTSKIGIPISELSMGGKWTPWEFRLGRQLLPVVSRERLGLWSLHSSFLSLDCLPPTGISDRRPHEHKEKCPPHQESILTCCCHHWFHFPDIWGCQAKQAWMRSVGALSGIFEKFYKANAWHTLSSFCEIFSSDSSHHICPPGSLNMVLFF